jgi:hypothetical protein
MSQRLGSASALAVRPLGRSGVVTLNLGRRPGDVGWMVITRERRFPQVFALGAGVNARYSARPRPCVIGGQWLDRLLPVTTIPLA